MGTSGKLSSPKPKVNNYFSRERRVLKLFGISLTGGESIAYRIYSFSVVFFLNFVYLSLCLVEVFKHDFDVVADMTIYIFATFITFCKVLVFLRNRIHIGKLLDELGREPFAVNLQRGGQQEEKLLKDYIWITQAQSGIYWLFSFVSVVTSASYTIIKRLSSSDYHDWELAYGPLTVLNITYSPNFEITWFYQTLSISYIGCHFTTIDVLVAAALAHISGQFKMLQNNFRRIVINSYAKIHKTSNIDVTSPSNGSAMDGSTIPWKFLQDSLKEAVQYHLAILDITREIEHVLSGLLLIVFLCTLVLLCFLIYHTSTIKNPVRTLRYVVEMGSICLQVATVCYWGEQIIFESQEVGRAASEADFVGTDVRFQKGLAMVIRRSQNPTRITAGKFADACLSTFVWVIRTSYSSFMVLRKNDSRK